MPYSPNFMPGGPQFPGSANAMTPFMPWPMGGQMPQQGNPYASYMAQVLGQGRPLGIGDMYAMQQQPQMQAPNVGGMMAQIPDMFRGQTENPVQGPTPNGGTVDSYGSPMGALGNLKNDIMNWVNRIPMSGRSQFLEMLR